MESNKKVLIVVYGGVVQHVFSSEIDVEIDLLDYDNEEFPDKESSEEEFKKRSMGLKQIL